MMNIENSTSPLSSPNRYHAWRNRQATAMYEQFVRETTDILKTTPGMDDALYGQRDEFIGYLENSFMPETTPEGVFEIPDEHIDSEGLPIIFVTPGVQRQLGKTFLQMTQTQIESARQAGFDTQKLTLHHPEDPQVEVLPGNVLGSVRTYTFCLENVDPVSGDLSHEYVFSGRPFLLLPQLWSVSEKVSPITAVHELQHVVQKIHSGYWKENAPDADSRHTADEFEGYHVSRQAGDRFVAAGVIEPDDSDYAQAVSIDSIRSIGCEPEDPYRLTEDGAKLMYFAGYESAVELDVSKILENPALTLFDLKQQQKDLSILDRLLRNI